MNRPSKLTKTLSLSTLLDTVNIEHFKLLAGQSREEKLIDQSAEYIK